MNDLQLLINVGAKIKKIRAQGNLSQNDLAMLCDFEKATVSRIEAGKANVTLLTLQKITKSLKIDMQELFKEHDEQVRRTASKHPPGKH